MPQTLRDLRKNSGLTLQQVQERLREIEPSAPETYVGLIHIENRGTDRLRIIRGLAQVYDLPLTEVEKAAACPVKSPPTETAKTP